MIDKLAEFTARLEAGDTAAFFFRGPRGGNSRCELPYPERCARRLRRCGGQSARCGARRTRHHRGAAGEVSAWALLVIDACRDNPFPRAPGRSIGNTRGLADAQPARGVFTLYSAGIGQTALDRLSDRDDREQLGLHPGSSPSSCSGPSCTSEILRWRSASGSRCWLCRQRMASGRPAPHEQTPAYYDQTLGGRIFLAPQRLQQALPQQPLRRRRKPRRPARHETAAAGCRERTLRTKRV